MAVKRGPGGIAKREEEFQSRQVGASPEAGRVFERQKNNKKSLQSETNHIKRIDQ